MASVSSYKISWIAIWVVFAESKRIGRHHQESCHFTRSGKTKPELHFSVRFPRRNVPLCLHFGCTGVTSSCASDSWELAGRQKNSFDMECAFVSSSHRPSASSNHRLGEAHMMSFGSRTKDSNTHLCVQLLLHKANQTKNLPDGTLLAFDS